MVRLSRNLIYFQRFGTLTKPCCQYVPGTIPGIGGEAVEKISEIMKKYPGQFSKDLALAILGDLERRCKENEDQNTGR